MTGSGSGICRASWKSRTSIPSVVGAGASCGCVNHSAGIRAVSTIPPCRPAQTGSCPLCGSPTGAHLYRRLGTELRLELAPPIVSSSRFDPGLARRHDVRYGGRLLGREGIVFGDFGDQLGAEFGDLFRRKWRTSRITCPRRFIVNRAAGPTRFAAAADRGSRSKGRQRRVRISL
jgi:hypothetical protein